MGCIPNQENVPHRESLALVVKGRERMCHYLSHLHPLQVGELFDKCVVGPIINGLKASRNEWRVCVLPDHATPVVTKTHTDEPVPFSIMGQGIESDGVTSFDENAAKKGRYGLVDATKIIGIMIENQQA